MSTPRPCQNLALGAKGALTGSPALKNLQGQGVASDAMPALLVEMMGMMDELAKSVSTLANKVDRIEAQVPQPEPPRKKAPLKPLPEPIGPTSEGSENIRAHDWCAVGFGWDNYSGVLSSWAEAAPWVVGVSGAIHSKCWFWEEGQTFVANTQRAQLQKKWGETHWRQQPVVCCGQIQPYRNLPQIG
jgi:hypothetical protein